MVHQQRIPSPGQTYSLEVPGNAEPDMVCMKITNRGDRTLTDVRVNTDKQFGDFHSLDTVLESAGVTKAEPTVENLKKLLRFYVQRRSLGRSALAKAIVDDPVLHTNIANTGMCCYNNRVAALLAQRLGFHGYGEASAMFGGAYAIAACMFDLHSRPHLERGTNVVTYRDASRDDCPRDVEVEFAYTPNSVAPVSHPHSGLEVPGAENALPADNPAHRRVAVLRQTCGVLFQRFNWLVKARDGGNVAFR